MTELEKAVAAALRLSDAAAEELLDTISRNIGIARAELIRSGVSPDKVNPEHYDILAEDAIVTFCLAKMGPESSRAAYESAFIYQQDNLRKSL